MKSFSTREWSFALVFLVTLVWGAWNYRHLFTDSSSVPPRAAATHATVHSASVGAEAGHTATGPATPVMAATLPRPDWGSDPFNRSWRPASSPAKNVK